MDYFNDPMFLRQIIMDHYEHPRNKRIGSDGHQHQRMDIASCIDDITVYVKLDGGTIIDLCFSGAACTIATASTSIMTELLMGKTIKQAQHIVAEYKKMVHLEAYDAALLQEAVAFKNVGRQANRIGCAVLGWHAFELIVAESEDSQ